MMADFCLKKMELANKKVVKNTSILITSISLVFNSLSYYVVPRAAHSDTGGVLSWQSIYASRI